MSPPSLTGGADTSTVRATVHVGGSTLSGSVEARLVRTVVDTHLHLPDMVELTFLDEEGSVLSDAGITVGSALAVFGGAPGSQQAPCLAKAEVTSVEAVCADLHIYTVVRGYDLAHRLQRARRTRTFLNMTDADIARQVASEAGLEVGTVDATRTTHEHLAQVDQSDWEFLTQRAREIGYETGVSGGTFYFRKPSGPDPAGGSGGLAGAAAGAVPNPLGGGGPPTLTFKSDLIEFHPRVTGADLTPDVEVRFWDPSGAASVSGTAPTATHTASLPGQDPATLATAFGRPRLPVAIPQPPSIPGMPSLGSPPSGTAWVRAGRPLADGADLSVAADEAAKGLAEHIGSVFAEAEGRAVGNPGVQAGAQVTIAAVPAPFAGTWTVTNARHVFDAAEGGYLTWFCVSGRQDRSLLGLASLGASQSGPPYLPGLVCGIVTNNNDPKTRGRVKVALPWLSPDYESPWVRVAQLGAGTASGMLFLPEVGDEVLLAFEYGDPRRPYVLGGLLNGNTVWTLGGSAVRSTGMAGTVVRRGYASPTGLTLRFEDDLAPPPPMDGGVPSTSTLTVGGADGAVALVIDQVGSTLKLSCVPTAGPGRAPVGSISIECGQAGSVSIKAGQGGSVSIDGGAQLKLSAQTVDIEAQTAMTIKGQPIQLN